jgi:osmotically-inducible protein OsmY
VSIATMEGVRSPDVRGRTEAVQEAGLPSCSTTVVQAATARLNRDPFLRFKGVFCELREGVLSLSGFLPSYYHKQLAQEAVRGLDGVQQVLNHIRVVPSAALSKEVGPCRG